MSAEEQCESQMVNIMLRCISMVTSIGIPVMLALGIFHSSRWFLALGGLFVLFMLQFIFVFRGAKLCVVNAFPARGSGVSGMRLTNETILTMKRQQQLLFAPLPSCITVLWDGLILCGAAKAAVIHARVRVVLNQRRDLWLLQRSRSKCSLTCFPFPRLLETSPIKYDGKGLELSTRDKIDSPRWETWYTARPDRGNGGLVTPPLGAASEHGPWQPHLALTRYRLCKKPFQLKCS